MVKTGLFKAIESLIPFDERLATFQGTGYSLKDKKRSQTRQNQARNWKEREKMSPTVPSDFIGPARYPFI
ncbi:hypothetical protein Tco_0285800 [Tanacetum coccineum]